MFSTLLFENGSSYILPVRVVQQGCNSREIKNSPQAKRIKFPPVMATNDTMRHNMKNEGTGPIDIVRAVIAVVFTTAWCLGIVMGIPQAETL